MDMLKKQLHILTYEIQCCIRCETVINDYDMNTPPDPCRGNEGSVLFISATPISAMNENERSAGPGAICKKKIKALSGMITIGDTEPAIQARDKVPALLFIRLGI